MRSLTILWLALLPSYPWSSSLLLVSDGMRILRFLARFRLNVLLRYIWMSPAAG